jgi:putative membrane protein
MTLGGSALIALLRYFSFTYRIEAGELVTSGGIISRNVRHIPLDRIQEIRVEQGVVHRLLGVVDARIETAGGGQGAEAVLSVLKQEDVDRLRAAVFAAAATLREGQEGAIALRPPVTGEASTVEAPSTLLLQLRTRDLVQSGLTTNHLVTLLVVVGGILRLDDIVPESLYREWIQATFERVGPTVDPAQLDPAGWAFLSGGAWPGPLLLLLAGLLGAVLLGALFSTGRAILLFHGFELSLRGENLHRSYGLLTHRSTSLPRRRIQVLKIEQKVLRRLFGMASLRVDTAGRQLEEKDGEQGRDILVPIMPVSRLSGLLQSVFPTLSLPSPEGWRPISRHAIWRGMLTEMLAVTLATGLLFWRVGWWGVLVLPLLALPICWLISRAQHRGRGYAIRGDFVHSRQGWLGRSVHVVPIEKIQEVEVVQGPFDRLFGLATIEIDTAGQIFTGGAPRIRFLPLGEALSLAGQLSQRTAQTRYRW